ncbi:MAG: GlsB/YeaQ/YmgE family stress response membrane protein [Bacillota bacterium]
MGILSWVVLGALAGWVASIIMKKNRSMGAFANIIVGIIGAFIGGFVMNLIGAKADVTGFNLESFLVALVGSIILLAIINLIRRGTVRNDK